MIRYALLASLEDITNLEVPEDSLPRQMESCVFVKLDDIVLPSLQPFPRTDQLDIEKELPKHCHWALPLSIQPLVLREQRDGCWSRHVKSAQLGLLLRFICIGR